MTNALNFITPPNPTVTAAAGPAPVEPVRKPQTQKSTPPKGDELADLRLVIEEDKDGVGFVYKTLDRRTGEVLQVLPRDSILKLAGDGYVPGTVVDQRT